MLSWGKQEGKEFEQLISGELPAGWEAALPTYTPEDKPLATRLHSQTNLNALASVLPGACVTRLPQSSSQDLALWQTLSGSVLGQGNFSTGQKKRALSCWREVSRSVLEFVRSFQE